MSNRVSFKILFFVLLLVLINLSSVPNSHATLDCNMSKEMRLRYLLNEYRLPYGVDKPLPGCMGWDGNDPGFANLTLSGIKFRIPRNYLSFDKKEADGPTGVVYLSFGVPKFNFVDEIREKEIATGAVLKPTGQRSWCDEARCYNFMQVLFLKEISGFDAFKEINRAASIATEKMKYAKVGIGRSANLKFLETEDYSAAFKTSNDEILEWHFCEKSRPRCNSHFIIENKIWVHLSLYINRLDSMIKYREQFLKILLPKIGIGLD